MEAEKLRNLTDDELLHQQRELNDQLFRMKFQLKMGQTESLNKLRGLRKDVARIKTILREKELGLANGGKSGASEEATAAEPAAKPKSAAKRPATRKRAVKKPAAKKTSRAKAKARQ